MLFVKNILNSRLASSVDQVDVLLESIKNENVTEVNFTGVDVITSNFASPFLWKLCLANEYNKLKLTGLSSSQKSLFQTVYELTSSRLGLKKIYYPKTKDELVKLISTGKLIAIRLNSLSDVKQAYKFLQEHFSDKTVTLLKEYIEDFSSVKSLSFTGNETLSYGYLSAELKDRFICLLPWYRETEEMKNNALNWSDLDIHKEDSSTEKTL